MVWRIHFRPDDLERIQVRPTLGPLAETVLGGGLLRCPQQPRTLLSEWRGQVKGRLHAADGPLTALIPPGSKGVDLSMLTGQAATLEQGVQALLAVPREHLLVEMEYTDRMHAARRGVGGGRDRAARLDLAAAAVAAHQVAGRAVLAPGSRPACTPSTWPASGRWRRAARRAAGLAAEPVGPLAAAGARGAGARHYDVQLNGRGLALMPSVFVGQIPSLHENPNDPD